METVISTVVALCMFVAGELTEHRIQPAMSDCLKGKRVAERVPNDNIEYKCGKVKVNNRIDDVAYMQVKDLTKNEDDKVFIFNGWTFASDPSLTPFDHAIYDLQLLNCYNV